MNRRSVFKSILAFLAVPTLAEAKPKEPVRIACINNKGTDYRISRDEWNKGYERFARHYYWPGIVTTAVRGYQNREVSVLIKGEGELFMRFIPK